MAIVLYGSGEFTDSVNEIDKYLIDKFNLKKVAVIPTAAGMEQDWHKWIDMAVEHFDRLNVDVIKIEAINHQQASNPEIVKKIMEADWIFYSGGQPDYLFKQLDGSLLWKLTMDKYRSGALLSGSSAGAMIMGNNIIDKPFRALIKGGETNWQKTFGIVDYTIFPHYNRMNRFKSVINKLIANAPEGVRKSVLGIDEDTALLIEDDEMKKLGGGNIELIRYGQVSKI